MKKKLLLVLVVVLVAGFAAYKYAYKPHRDIGSEEASYSLSVSELQQQFTANDSLANSVYADKTIAMYGKITAIDVPSNTITVDGKLSAVLMGPVAKDLKVQQQVKIKGRFVGYDDLLEELKMDQVTLQN
jgi:putative nucleic acid binding protein